MPRAAAKMTARHAVSRPAVIVARTRTPKEQIVQARDAADKLVVDGELVLYGTVGDGFFGGDSFSARETLDALSTLRGDLTVRINSGGGNVFDGLAIYNSLKAHKGNVTVKVDGIAASAASIIAMAGDRIVAPASATMMIHKAWQLTIGNETDHTEAASLLGKVDGQLRDIYVERTGLKRAEVERMMESETWMTGTEAVAKGFADRTTDEPAEAFARFPYDKYRRAPAALLEAAQPRKPRTDREFERFLRDHGFSQSAAAALTARGWQDRRRPKPAGVDFAAMAKRINLLTEELRLS